MSETLAPSHLEPFRHSVGNSGSPSSKIKGKKKRLTPGRRLPPTSRSSPT